MSCATSKAYAPLGKYPEMVRDLAVALPKSIPAGDVEAQIKACGGDLLREIRLFDEYKGSQLGQNQKSLAFALTWRSDDRTLMDEEINLIHRQIEERLAEAFGGVIRGR